MKKVRSNALWNQLSPSQRKTLDEWLFEEKLGYAAILPRAKSELGFKGSEGSLRRYYARRDKERTVKEFTGLRDEIANVNGAPVDAVTLRSATQKVMGGFVFRQVRQAPEEVEKWAPVAQLMARQDYTEMLREAKGEERKIRRDAIDFAKERFRFDTIERALKALPELLKLAEAKKDPQTKGYEENCYWNGVLRAMFGAGSEVYPENPREEAEMVAAKKEREARKEQEVRAGSEREGIMNAQPPPPSSPYYQEYMERIAKEEEGHE